MATIEIIENPDMFEYENEGRALARVHVQELRLDRLPPVLPLGRERDKETGDSKVTGFTCIAQTTECPHCEQKIVDSLKGRFRILDMDVWIHFRAPDWSFRPPKELYEVHSIPTIEVWIEDYIVSGWYIEGRWREVLPALVQCDRWIDQLPDFFEDAPDWELFMGNNFPEPTYYGR